MKFTFGLALALAALVGCDKGDNAPSAEPEDPATRELVRELAGCAWDEERQNVVADCPALAKWDELTKAMMDVDDRNGSDAAFKAWAMTLVRMARDDESEAVRLVAARAAHSVLYPEHAMVVLEAVERETSPRVKRQLHKLVATMDMGHKEVALRAFEAIKKSGDPELEVAVLEAHGNAASRCQPCAMYVEETTAAEGKALVRVAAALAHAKEGAPRDKLVGLVEAASGDDQALAAQYLVKHGDLDDAQKQRLVPVFRAMAAKAETPARCHDALRFLYLNDSDRKPMTTANNPVCKKDIPSGIQTLAELEALR